jgi:hypothetical protein
MSIFNFDTFVWKYLLQEIFNVEITYFFFLHMLTSILWIPRNILAFQEIILRFIGMWICSLAILNQPFIPQYVSIVF